MKPVLHFLILMIKRMTFLLRLSNKKVANSFFTNTSGGEAARREAA
jgi:hypothetical protein